MPNLNESILNMSNTNENNIVQSNTFMSPSINELATALAKAQAEMQVANKNQSNSFFKSKYADIQDVVNASRPALSKHGLSICQIPLQDNQLKTLLMHSSGQWISSTIKLRTAKDDMQSLGAATTYAKRIAYAAICGVVVGEDDDDGNTASGNNYPKTNGYTPYKEEVITKEQYESLNDELEGHLDIAKNMLQAFNLETLKDMPKSKFLASIKRIRELKDLKKS